MTEFKPTGKTVNAICYGESHPECECYSDGLPRELPMYACPIGDDLSEVRPLCGPCRKRLQKVG